MTYRDPQPRPPRLWHVTITYGKPIGPGDVVISALRCFAWGKEQSDAIEAAIKQANKEGHDVPKTSVTHAVCGEDFAEIEAKGPPT